jgi:hypothetical protein
MIKAVGSRRLPMMTLGLFWLGLVAGDVPAPPVPPPTVGADPAIRLWINNSSQFRQGEEARVQVETQNDGYLLVLNYDSEGHLRVLFPLSPRDDNFVHGGRFSSLRSRSMRPPHSA